LIQLVIDNDFLLWSIIVRWITECFILLLVIRSLISYFCKQTENHLCRFNLDSCERYLRYRSSESVASASFIINVIFRIHIAYGAKCIVRCVIIVDWPTDTIKQTLDSSTCVYFDFQKKKTEWLSNNYPIPIRLLRDTQNFCPLAEHSVINSMQIAHLW